MEQKLEQKKLLLIAISVGVFFVLVIGAALAASRFMGPAVPASRPIAAGTAYTTPGPEETPEPSRPSSISPSAYVQGDIQGISPPSEGSLPENNTFYVSGDGSSQTAVPAEKPVQTLITVDPKSAAGVPDASLAGRTAASPRPAAVKPAAKKSPEPKPAAVKTPAPVKTHDDYWVQAGAFTIIGRAETVKETLAEKGINSIIENRDVDGTTYFRVRVGPYTSKNEADYWLSLIKSISGFEDSQIRLSQSKR